MEVCLIFTSPDGWYSNLGSREHFAARVTQHANVKRIASTRPTTPIIKSLVVSISWYLYRECNRMSSGIVPLVVMFVLFILGPSVSVFICRGKYTVIRLSLAGLCINWLPSGSKNMGNMRIIDLRTDSFLWALRVASIIHSQQNKKVPPKTLNSPSSCYAMRSFFLTASTKANYRRQVWFELNMLRFSGLQASCKKNSLPTKKSAPHCLVQCASLPCTQINFSFGECVATLYAMEYFTCVLRRRRLWRVCLLLCTLSRLRRISNATASNSSGRHV